MLVNANLLASNDRLESRMREIRQSGSEGGGRVNRGSLPLSVGRRWARITQRPAIPKEDVDGRRSVLGKRCPTGAPGSARGGHRVIAWGDAPSRGTPAIQRVATPSRRPR